MIKRNDIPNSVKGLMRFWEEEADLNEIENAAIRSDILAYLGWVEYLLGEVGRYETALDKIAYAKHGLIIKDYDSQCNEIVEVYEKIAEDAL